MTQLLPLVDVQELDLAGDRLRVRRSSLPERDALERLAAEAPRFESALAELARQRAEFGRAEQGFASEVAELAAKAKTVETTLYSGSVRAPKELSALQEEIRLFRVRQSEIETRELEVLESIEQTEREMAEKRAARAALDEDAQKLRVALASTEHQIDGELAALATTRSEKLLGIPEALVGEYEKRRGRKLLGGRALARLVQGGCTGCHMKLPVLEANTMNAQPEDALLVCGHCGRMLVR